MRRTLGIWAVGLVLALVTLPLAVHADEGSPDGSGPLPVLTNLLGRLDEQLVAVQSRVAEADRPLLEKELAAAVDLLEKLLNELGTPPQSDEQKPSLKEELGTLDRVLHRLLEVLETIVAPAGLSPEKETAKEAASELRTWVDGYVAGVTTRMDPREAREFEAMARTLLGKVAETLTRGLRPTRPANPSPLEVLLHRLQGLVARLDQALVRTFGPRPVVSPKP
jgi:hypothetical protein